MSNNYFMRGFAMGLTIVGIILLLFSLSGCSTWQRQQENVQAQGVAASQYDQSRTEVYQALEALVNAQKEKSVIEASGGDTTFVSARLTTLADDLRRVRQEADQNYKRLQAANDALRKGPQGTSFWDLLLATAVAVLGGGSVIGIGKRVIGQIQKSGTQGA